jgi:hypothetical protein
MIGDSLYMSACKILYILNVASEMLPLIQILMSITSSSHSTCRAVSHEDIETQQSGSMRIVKIH